MKKTLLISLLILGVAIIGWVGGYRFLAHPHRRPPSTEQIMAWMQKEFKLTPEQYTAIRKSEEEFRHDAKPKFQELRQKRKAVKEMEANKATKPDDLAKAKEELSAQRTTMKAMMQEHLQTVAAMMSPEQAAVFLKKIEERKPRR